MSSTSYSSSSNSYSYGNSSQSSYYMPTDFTSAPAQRSWGSQTSPTMTIRPPPTTYGSTGVSMYYSGVRRFR